MKGCTRHLPVDTDGLILERRVLPADSADRETAIGLLAAAREGFPRPEPVWADRGYTGERVRAAGEAAGIRVEIVAWPERRAVWMPAGVEPPSWP